MGSSSCTKIKKKKKYPIRGRIPTQTQKNCEIFLLISLMMFLTMLYHLLMQYRLIEEK